MHTRPLLALVFIISLFTFSCKDDDTSSNTPDDQSNEDRTYEEAMDYYNELRDILIDLTTSEGLTREANFPTSGKMTYQGVYVGIRTNSNTHTSSTALLFVADMTLTLDFATGSYTGSLDNFTTDLSEFEQPEGTAEINGAVRGTAELGGDEFGLSLLIDESPLTEGDLSADFDGLTADKGRFYGVSAQFIAIGIQSTFDWTSGPDTGTTSGTSGFVYIQAVE